jgi:N-acetylglutamate synthase-like GNAT family acetyltransferase
MQGTFFSPFFGGQSVHAMSGGWLARRWYYTPRTHRAYSVRQVSPGDRRLLAEFALGLSRIANEQELAAVRELSSMIFDRVFDTGSHDAIAFVALENTAGGDRVVGVCAYSVAGNHDPGNFCVAVAEGFRDEQVGRTLLATLVRHAKRAGVSRLFGETCWSNRAMQRLAASLGFAIEPVARDRKLRRVVLTLR